MDLYGLIQEARPSPGFKRYSGLDLVDREDQNIIVDLAKRGHCLKLRVIDDADDVAPETKLHQFNRTYEIFRRSDIMCAHAHFVPI